MPSHDDRGVLRQAFDGMGGKYMSIQASDPVLVVGAGMWRCLWAGGDEMDADRRAPTTVEVLSSSVSDFVSCLAPSVQIGAAPRYGSSPEYDG